jgi:hypothetical protein
MDATTNRRRSQRLFLQVRVIVAGKLANQSTFSEETHTIVVNAHGALVEMAEMLEQGQSVSLQNVRTSEKIDCRVMLVKPVASAKFSTAFELSLPIRTSGGSASRRMTGPRIAWSRKRPADPLADARVSRRLRPGRFAHPQNLIPTSNLAFTPIFGDIAPANVCSAGAAQGCISLVNGTGTNKKGGDNQVGYHLPGWGGVLLSKLNL